MLDEPGAGNPLAGVGEGEGRHVMENLNGHETGNGGHSQGDTYCVRGTSSTRSRSLIGDPVR